MTARTLFLGLLAALSVGVPTPGVGRADDPKVPDGVDPKMTSDDADYGYKKAKPIKLGAESVFAAPRASRAYLDALRDGAGKPVKYKRQGSVGAGDDGHVLDLYVVTTSAGKDLELYIDMYHPENDPGKQLVPRGLYKAKK